MTPTARTVLPTDLVALVSYDGRVYANQAMTRDRIGTEDSPHPLETAFEQWFSFATGRHTCVSVKGPTLRGLVSGRKRGGKLVWEIDCLINAAEADTGVLLSLLDRMTAAAGKSGAFRIFVRVEAGCEIEREIAASGFMPYLQEQVYRRATVAGDAHRPADGLRRRTKTDAYGLFQLYNAVVPEEVRRHEAMTFAEWTASQESLGRTTQYVIERDDAIAGLLRVAGDGDLGRFDVIADDAALEPLIEAALAKVANRKSAYTLVSEHQESLARRLEAAGFEPGDAYTVLARRTVRPVKAGRKKVARALVQTHTTG